MIVTMMTIMIMVSMSLWMLVCLFEGLCVCVCSMLHVLHVSGAMLHLSFDFVAPRVQSS